MKKAAVLAHIREVGVIPVVRAASAAEACALGEAIVAGGLPVLEITMTVPGAVEAIRSLSARLGDGVLVGAGSVLDEETARQCVAAGARLIVTPVLAPDVIAYCREQDVAVIAGALTPTEIVEAWEAGADLVKVFPAGAMGGASYIKSLRGPLPDILLVPTSGVTLANVASFVEAGAVAVGVGTDLANAQAIRRGEAGTVTATARAYVEAIAAARKPAAG